MWLLLKPIQLFMKVVEVVMFMLEALCLCANCMYSASLCMVQTHCSIDIL